MSGSYTHNSVRPHILALQPKVIIECGAADCQDSLDILEVYKPDKLFAFEANPDNVRLCYNTISKAGTPANLEFIPQALTDCTGITKFYPVDVAHSANNGVSSLFQFKEGCLPEFKLQSAIIVPCTRLDDFLLSKHIPHVDLLCLDMEGGELRALQGAGSYLAGVSAIICEVRTVQWYMGAPLLKDMEEFLRYNGFELKTLYNFNGFGDALFLKGGV